MQPLSVLERCTINDKTIILGSGSRIVIDQLAQQDDISYLAKGKTQMAGLLGFRTTGYIEIKYMPDGTYKSLTEIPSDPNDTFRVRFAAMFRDLFDG